MAVAITSTVNLVFGSQVLDSVTGVILNDEVSLPQYSTYNNKTHVLPSWTTSPSPASQMHSGSSPHPVSPLFSPSPTHFSSPLHLSSSDNYPKGGKRPLSSTAPTVVVDSHTDDVLAVVGASGGSKIFPAVFQTLLNLEWGLDAREAVEFGRLHDQLFPQFVEADNVFPADLIEELRGRGHNITCEFSSLFVFREGMFIGCGAVMDISRVAAVVQLVMKDGDTIYGTCFLFVLIFVY